MVDISSYNDDSNDNMEAGKNNKTLERHEKIIILSGMIKFIVEVVKGFLMI